MIRLNMIDAIGSGVKRVFERQRKRFFPMPTYSFWDNRVSVELFGKILDLRYGKLLAKNSDLSLLEIIALDKVQKGKIKEIEKSGVDLLKRKWLVEWRYPNIYLSESVSVKIWMESNYLKNKWMKDDYYREKICERIQMGKQSGVTKPQIRELVQDMLPDSLAPSQKENKLTNLIQDLRKQWRIKLLSGGKYTKWIIN